MTGKIAEIAEEGRFKTEGGEGKERDRGRATKSSDLS